MSYKPREAQPRPLITCPACRGTGLDPLHATAYLGSRRALTDTERLDAIRCAACGGQGRLTAEHALAIGLRIPAI